MFTLDTLPSNQETLNEKHISSGTNLTGGTRRDFGSSVKNLHHESWCHWLPFGGSSWTLLGLFPHLKEVNIVAKPCDPWWFNTDFFLNQESLRALTLDGS